MSENDQNEVTPEALPGPTVLGDLTPEELDTVIRLSGQRVRAEREIAQLEIRKYRVLAEVDGSERALTQLMQAIQSRLQVPPDIPCTVMRDEGGQGHLIMQSVNNFISTHQE